MDVLTPRMNPAQMLMPQQQGAAPVQGGTPPIMGGYDSQMAKVKRQKQMAEMLLKNSQQPQGTQMVGGIAIQNSPLQAFSAALGQGAGAYYGTKADEQATELARQRAQAMAQAYAKGGNIGQNMIDAGLTDEASKILAKQAELRAKGDNDIRVYGAKNESDLTYKPQIAGATITAETAPKVQQAQAMIPAEAARAGAISDATYNNDVAKSLAGRSIYHNQVNMPQVEQSALINSNKDAQTVYRKVLDEGAGASSANALIDASAALDVNSKTGWGTEKAAQAANILVSLGIGGEEAKQLATSAQAFNSVMQQQTFQKLQQATGPQTDDDARRAQEQFAKLGNTPEANKYIRALAKATNNLAVKKARYFSDNQQDALKSGNLATIENGWNKKGVSIFDDPILKPYLPKQTPAGGNANRPPEIQNLVNQYKTQ